MLSLMIIKTANNIVSANNSIPLEVIPEEFLALLSTVTEKGYIVIGRKLYEQLNQTIPFPNRETYVITRIPKYRKVGVSIIHSPNNIAFKKKDIFVLGGINTFKTFYPYADRICILHSSKEIIGINLDLEFFPDYFMNNFLKGQEFEDTILCRDGSIIQYYNRNKSRDA